MLEEYEIFQKIEDYIYKHHDLPYARLDATWFKDLGLTQYDHDVFCEWVEKTFHITLPHGDFGTLGELTKTIYVLTTQKQKTSLFTRIKQRFQLVK